VSDDHELIWLYEDDMAVIMTVDGKFFGIWSHDDKVCYENADFIQEWMLIVMKEEEHRQGAWSWRIKQDEEQIIGQYLGEIDDEDNRGKELHADTSDDD